MRFGKIKKTQKKFVCRAVNTNKNKIINYINQIKNDEFICSNGQIYMKKILSKALKDCNEVLGKIEKFYCQLR